MHEDEYDYVKSLVEEVSELTWGLSSVADGLQRQYAAGVSSVGTAEQLSTAILHTAGRLAYTRNLLVKYVADQRRAASEADQQ